MPITENFSLPAGDSILLEFDVEGNPGENLSGSTIRWQLFRQKFGEALGAPIVVKSTGGGGISIDDNVELTFTVTLNAEDTEGLIPGRYYHEAEIKFADGTVATPTIGFLTIEPTYIQNA